MSWPRHVVLFATSRRNIAGCVGALVGVGLFVVGITPGLIGVGAIVGLYVIGYLVVPGPHPQPVQPAAADDADAVSAGLDRLLVSIHGRVADDIFTRAESIRESITVTLPAAAGSLSVVDPNVYLIRRTALAYLPEALSNYLAIPRAYAEGQTVADGRTPHDALLEQLDLMDSKMREVADDIARHDIDKLLANGRFVAERFATSSLSAVPTAVPASISAQDGQSVHAPVAEPERENVR